MIVCQIMLTFAVGMRPNHGGWGTVLEDHLGHHEFVYLSKLAVSLVQTHSVCSGQIEP